jgi:predicted transposase/invertase (TIGR01784 family)
MGGKVLDLPETIFFNRGVEQGIEQGIEQGTARIVENMLRLGKSCADIMESTGCSEEMIRQIEEQMKTKTV